jgi:hypothetical protein
MHINHEFEIIKPQALFSAPTHAVIGDVLPTPIGGGGYAPASPSGDGGTGGAVFSSPSLSLSSLCRSPSLIPRRGASVKGSLWPTMSGPLVPNTLEIKKKKKKN